MLQSTKQLTGLETKISYTSGNNIVLINLLMLFFFLLLNLQAQIY